MLAQIPKTRKVAHSPWGLYYTVERDATFARQSTDYHARPTDGKAKAALIWLDKQARRLYSRAKERSGVSDNAASKILGFLSRKK